MPRKSQWSGLGRRRKSSPIEILHYDALSLILEQLCQDNRCHLLTLSRVCRDFYLAAIPYIYKEVRIDISKKSNLDLLRRLSKRDSKLPAKIQELTVRADGLGLTQELLFNNLVPRLLSLRKFTWLGSADIPEFVPHVFHSMPPQVQITVNAKQIRPQSLSLWCPSPRPLIHGNPTSHPASSQLVILELQQFHPLQFYPTFKAELMGLLSNSPKLQKLTIRPNGHFVTRPYSSMLQILQNTKFPKLKGLCLMSSVTIFTKEELTLWGQQGGWDRLEELSLHLPSDIPTFIGQVPSLQTLVLSFDLNADIDALKEILDETEEESPFGPIESLVYNSPLNESTIPWFILNHVYPTLVKLRIAHNAFILGTPDFGGIAPDAQDIDALRTICSDLEELKLDFVVPNVVRRRGDIYWPEDLLSELARFHKMRHLRLYIHQPMSLNETVFTSRSNYRRCYRKVYKTRKQLSLPSGHGSFKMGFKAVVPRNYNPYSWNQADYEVWGHGRTVDAWRPDTDARTTPDYSNKTNEELNQLRKKFRWSRWAGLGYTDKAWQDNRNYKESGMQKARNRIAERASKAFGDDTTLFDLWAGQGTGNVVKMQ